MTYISGGTTKGLLRLSAPTPAPAVSLAGEGRIYFDGIQFLASENGAAYAAIVGGGGTLSSVLAAGNTTGANDIVVSTGQEIRGAVELDLRTTGGGVTSGPMVIATGATINGLGGISGDVTVSTGNATVGGDSVLSGSITVQTGTGEDSGSVTIATGGAEQSTGSVSMTTGNSVSGGPTGDIALTVGSPSGTAPCGSIDITTPGGYTAGYINIYAGGAGPGGGGGLSLGAADIVGISGSGVFVAATTFVGPADMTFTSTGPSGSFTWLRNPGTPTTQLIMDDSGWTFSGGSVYGINSVNPSFQGGNNSSAAYELRAAGSTFTSGGSLIQMPALMYDPQSGLTYTKLGNSVIIDGDGTHNTVSGLDATAQKRQVLVGSPGAGVGEVVDLSVYTLTGTPLVPGTVVIRSIRTVSGTFDNATDDGAGNFPPSLLLPGGGTVDYSTGALTGSTAPLEGGADVAAYYVTTNGAGENLTPRGGNGQGTGAGGELRLRGGAGGATGAGGAVTLTGGAGGATSGTAAGVTISGGVPVDGNGGAVSLTGSAGVGTNRDGGGVSLAPGAATGSGVAGTVQVCTTTAQLLRFYGTAAGVAQQSVTGSRGGNAALASLLTALANAGLIVDNTTA